MVVVEGFRGREGEVWIKDNKRIKCKDQKHRKKGEYNFNNESEKIKNSEIKSLKQNRQKIKQVQKYKMCREPGNARKRLRGGSKGSCSFFPLTINHEKTKHAITLTAQWDAVSSTK